MFSDVGDKDKDKISGLISHGRQDMIKSKAQDQPDMGGRVILFGRPASSGGEPGEVAVGGGGGRGVGRGQART